MTPRRLSVGRIALLVLLVVLAVAAPVGPTTPVANAAPVKSAFMLGDSVMLGAQSAITKRLAGWNVIVDAKVSRSTLAGLDVLRARRSEIHDAVVIQLGTNDGGNPTIFRQRVDAVMAELHDVAFVDWLTIREARSYYAATNQVLRDAAKRWPNMHVADWNAVALATPDAEYSDGLHLKPNGAAAMANLVGSELETWYSAGAGSSAAPSPKGCSAPAPDSRVVASASAGRGYWLLDSAGVVHGLGGAPALGDLHAEGVTTPPVSLQSTPTGNGYWIVDRDGKVYAFGDAVLHGDMSGQRLNGPIRRLEPDPQGHGYWLLGSDGGVFAFDVPFFGSAGARPPDAPVISITATPTGEGYWMVTAAGAVLTFGDARYDGSASNLALQAPVLSLAVGPAGSGYWLYAADGGVFSFGVPFFGSVPGLGLCELPATVALRATDTGDGYWIVTASGRVFPFGDAPDYGSVADLGAGVTAIDLAVRH